MTDQISEVLYNELHDICLEDYQLYCVWKQKSPTQAEWVPYSFRVKADSDKCEPESSCWRGYVSTFLLDNMGHLTLVEYAYPDRYDTDNVQEQLVGNFWVELRKGFYGDKAFVPFIDGKIQKDKSTWMNKRPA